MAVRFAGGCLASHRAALAPGKSSGGIRLSNEIADLRNRLKEAETLFDRLRDAVHDPGGVDFAPLALFRQIMQMADGILILADAGSVGPGPMFPLLRAMLECYFSLEFIIGQGPGDPDNWKKKSLAWLVFCLNQYVAQKEMSDTSTNRGKTFKSELKAHDRGTGRRGFTHLKPIVDPDYSALPLRERLAESDLAQIQAEYLSVKPHYFCQLMDLRLDGIEKLARESKQWDYYKIYYGPYSAAVHGTDPLRLLVEKADGTVAYGPLRTSEEHGGWVAKAETILHLASVALAKHYSQTFADEEATPKQ
jgi:hypothetical protein